MYLVFAIIFLDFRLIQSKVLQLDHTTLEFEEIMVGKKIYMHNTAV